MTVSYALRNDPQISKAVRQQIRATARRMGYRPDAALSALIAYRRPVHAHYTGTLAWVINRDDPESWKGKDSAPGHARVYWHYYLGAKARARALGYEVEELWLQEPGMTPQRFSRMLLARNIAGLLLPPQGISKAELHLDWGSFSSVAFGYSLASPRLHAVNNNHFRSTVTIFQKLRELGYRRIGLAISLAADERVENQYSAAFFSECRHQETDRIPVLIDPDEGNSLPWVQAHRLDAVIAHGRHILTWLEKAGYRAPEEIGFASLALEPDETHYTGIDENDQEIGSVAVDLLVGELHRNERGVPALPRRVLIDGTWKQNRTVRRQAAAEARSDALSSK